MRFVELIVLMTLVFIALSEQNVGHTLMEKILIASENCTTSSGGSFSDVHNLLNNKIPITREGKCMIFCMFVHFSLQSKDGKSFSPENVTILDPVKDSRPDIHERFLNISITCIDRIEDSCDPCIYAARFAACAVAVGNITSLEGLFTPM